jgi:hypothetical protein
MSFFRELEEYIMCDEDHCRRVAERNEARKGNTGTMWRPHFQNPRNINNVENLQLRHDNRPNTRGGLAPREEEGEEDPRNSQTITQEIHISTANITEEVITPKGVQKPRRTSLKFSKRKP